MSPTSTCSWNTIGTQIDNANNPIRYNAKAGIDVEFVNGIPNVKRVLARFGPRTKYPNQIINNYLHYCYSPSASATQAMQYAYDNDISFPVYITSRESSHTYFLQGKITNLMEKYICPEDNKIWFRYVIQESTALPAVPTEGQLDQRSASDLRSPVARSAAPVEGQVATVGAISNKRARTEQVFTYDSFLERKHAEMMQNLGIECSRNVPSMHDIDIGGSRTVDYTPDFTVLNQNGERYIVEIKPRFPYDVEVRRCIGYCKQLPERKLVLLYNTKFVCPYSSDKNDQGQGDYKHSDGVRGMMFVFNNTTKKVDIVYNVSYYCAVDEAGSIQHAGFKQRDFVCDDEMHLFDNSVLRQAYESAEHLSK